jgi:hypothetical protein
MEKVTELDLRTIETEEPTAFIVVAGHNGGGCTLYKSMKPRSQATDDADKLIDKGECDYAEVLSIEKAVAELLDNEE